MLTTKQVEREKRPGRYRDGHIRGLYLQVGPTGGKSWLLRFERDGRERWLGSGPCARRRPENARERARAARLLLLDGIDPIDHRKAEKAKLAAAKAKLLIFREAAQQYFDQHERKWKNAKHRTQFTNTLRQYAFPVLGDMAVADIGTPEVLRAIEPHWHTKTETMSRVRGRIEIGARLGGVRGYRTGDNPARWTGHLSEVLPARGEIKKTVHHPAMPYPELPAFMAELRKREGVAARALEFAILTAARTGEVIGAHWDEIDLEDKMWTVPAGRMKGGKEHRVPLIGARHRAAARAADRGRQRFRFHRIARRHRVEQHDTGADAQTHESRRRHRAWISQHLPRLGRRDNQLSELRCRDGAGARDSATRSKPAYRRGDLLAKRKAAERGVVEILHIAATGRRGGAAAQCMMTVRSVGARRDLHEARAGG